MTLVPYEAFFKIIIPPTTTHLTWGLPTLLQTQASKSLNHVAQAVPENNHDCTFHHNHLLLPVAVLVLIIMQHPKLLQLKLILPDLRLLFLHAGYTGHHGRDCPLPPKPHDV